LIHERKFANTHKELFKQCVQDIPAIRKAKYPLVIEREQAMINAIEAKLPNLTVRSPNNVMYLLAALKVQLSAYSQLANKQHIDNGD